MQYIVFCFYLLASLLSVRSLFPSRLLYCSRSEKLFVGPILKLTWNFLVFSVSTQLLIDLFLRSVNGFETVALIIDLLVLSNRASLNVLFVEASRALNLGSNLAIFKKKTTKYSISDLKKKLFLSI